MKILIEMTPKHYDEFLNTVHPDWLLQYSVLKNGVVVRKQIEGKEQRMIQILCEEFQADVLLRDAETVSPDAAQDIRTALNLRRGL